MSAPQETAHAAPPFGPPEKVRVTVLGCGTSTGVPSIGCTCPICTSSDPKNKRLRPSLFLEVFDKAGNATHILVDTTPDMRTQVLRAGITRVDAVLITHTHADHIFGMDDLRQFNFIHQRPIPVYATSDVLAQLQVVFCLLLSGHTNRGRQAATATYSDYPLLSVCTIAGLSIVPLTVLHGALPVTAFKFGPNFAYVTDVSAIPDETFPHLRHLDTLILDAVRFDPHPTHFGLYQAIEVAQTVMPRQTYLTHLGHQFEYNSVMKDLPKGIALAHDGLNFSVAAQTAGH